MFLKVRDQVSHPYSTTGKIRLSYVRVVTNDELKERKEAAMTDIFLE
jgi:hypothetical protein